MTIGADQSLECALELSELSGKFARECIEGGAPSAPVLERTAKYVRLMGIELLCSAEFDPIEACAARLGRLASDSPHGSDSSFDSESAARSAVTWRELQQVQAEHDVRFTPNFADLSAREQFTQRAMELARVAGEAAENLCGFEPSPGISLEDQLADMVILGLRLSTAADEELSAEEEVPRTMQDHSIALLGQDTFEEYEEDEQ